MTAPDPGIHTSPTPNETDKNTPVVTFRHALPDEAILHSVREHSARLAARGVRVQGVRIDGNRVLGARYRMTLVGNHGRTPLRVRVSGADLEELIERGMTALAVAAQHSLVLRQGRSPWNTASIGSAWQTVPQR